MPKNDPWNADDTNAIDGGDGPWWDFGVEDLFCVANQGKAEKQIKQNFWKIKWNKMKWNEIKWNKTKQNKIK